MNSELLEYQVQVPATTVLRTFPISCEHPFNEVITMCSTITVLLLHANSRTSLQTQSNLERKTLLINV